MLLLLPVGLLGAPACLLGTVLLVEPADDGGEVAGAVSDVVAMYLFAKGGLCRLEDLQGETTESSNEALSRTRDVVEVVNLTEEQDLAAVLGTRLLPMLPSGVYQVLTGQALTGSRKC